MEGGALKGTRAVEVDDGERAVAGEPGWAGMMAGQTGCGAAALLFQLRGCFFTD
jgi:hypothetical protein